MNLGIDKNANLVYEARDRHGFAVWPTPVILQVSIAPEDQTRLNPQQKGGLAPHSIVFREDSFDPTSRTRRGRMYRADSALDCEWFVHPHPAIPSEIRKSDHAGGYLRKHLATFHSMRLRPYLTNINVKRPVYVMGSEDEFTIWTLVSIETGVTGEEILTLRARKSIGALPHLRRDKILAADGESVIRNLEILEDDLFRAGPESVVDRAREAATAILSKYLQSVSALQAGKDLANLANKLSEERFDIAANCAKIIARLHARGKHAEQEKRALRHITEQDAEFAVRNRMPSSPSRLWARSCAISAGDTGRTPCTRTAQDTISDTTR